MGSLQKSYGLYVLYLLWYMVCHIVHQCDPHRSHLGTKAYTIHIVCCLPLPRIAPVNGVLKMPILMTSLLKAQFAVNKLPLKPCV